MAALERLVVCGECMRREKDGKSEKGVFYSIFFKLDLTAGSQRLYQNVRLAWLLQSASLLLCTKKPCGDLMGNKDLPSLEALREYVLNVLDKHKTNW